MGAGLGSEPEPQDALPPSVGDSDAHATSHFHSVGSSAIPSREHRGRETCVGYGVSNNTWDACGLSNGFDEGETEMLDTSLRTHRLGKEFNDGTYGCAEHFEVNYTVETTPPVVPELWASVPIHGSSEVRTEVLTKSRLGHRRLLGDGVVLTIKPYTSRKGRDRLTFSVANNKLSPLQCSFDLSAWEDAVWLDGDASSRKKTVHVEPSQVMQVGNVEEHLGPWHGHEPQLKCEWKHMTGPTRSPAEARQLEAHIRKQLDLMKENSITDTQYSTAHGIQHACKQTGLRFTDVSFPPCDAAIYGDRSQQSGTAYVWRRPPEIMEHLRPEGDTYSLGHAFHQSKASGVSLYGNDGIQPTDIKQGALGDCWFLAAVAAVAEEPSLVQALFKGNQVNMEGVYQITCFKDGKPTIVIIDDWLPCSSTTGSPCFTHTHNNEIWVALLEKAWAKLHGSYSALEAGLPYQAMMDLCCKPGKCLIFDNGTDNGKGLDQWKLTRVLQDLHRSGDLLVASSGSEGTGPEEPQDANADWDGLVANHAYTVLRFQEVERQTLICLRNPWGNFEWHGEWGDSSLRWTQEAQKEAKYEPDDDDGVFWMNEKEFYQHFKNVHVLHRRERGGAPWSAQRHTIPLIGALGQDEALVSVIQIEVTSTVDGFCTLWQPDHKVPNSSPYNKMAFGIYGPVGVENMREVIRSHCWARRELVVTVPQLRAGTYWIAIWNADVSRAPPDGTAQFHLHLANPRSKAKKGFSLKRIGSQDVLDAKDMVFQSQAVKLRSRPDIVGVIKGGAAMGICKGRRFVDHGQFLLSASWGPDGTHGIAVCAKPDSPKCLKIVVDFSGSDGLKVVPGRTALHLRDKVEVILRVQDGWCLTASLVPQQETQIVKYSLHWATLS